MNPTETDYKKIRPLFEALRRNCLSQGSGEYNFIDEKIMPFKGKNFLKRDMLNRPH